MGMKFSCISNRRNRKITTEKHQVLNLFSVLTCPGHIFYFTQNPKANLKYIQNMRGPEKPSSEKMGCS